MMASNSIAKRSGSAVTIVTACPAMHEVAMAALLRKPGGGGRPPPTPTQASICFLSLSAREISILRGFACGATGMRRVRTPDS